MREKPKKEYTNEKLISITKKYYIIVYQTKREIFGNE